MALDLRRMTRYVQQPLSVVDMLGKMREGQINRFYFNRVRAKLYSSETGFKINGEELVES